MAGISGSSFADSSAIGALMLPTLRKSKYGDGFSVSVIASAASLGPIIPPSIIMIIYSSVTGFPAGKLFISGVLPGLLLGVLFMVIVYVHAVRIKIPTAKFGGFMNILSTLKYAIWALFMPVIILGGILSGAFTPTEAGVVATVYGLVYGLVTRRLELSGLIRCLRDAVIGAAGPMVIIAVSGLFGNMLVRLNVTMQVSKFCETYISSPVMFYLFIIVICLIAGMFIDPGATMLMLIPVLLPVVNTMQLDTLQFAAIFIVALLTAVITPPVGMNLFIVSSIGDIPFNKCIKPILPFVGVFITVLIMMIFIPGISTWLPSLMA
jgi:C4-dicarboxylate transporter DctM subunit